MVCIDRKSYIISIVLVCPSLYYETYPSLQPITPVPCIRHDVDHTAVRDIRLFWLLVALGFCLVRGNQLEWPRHIMGLKNELTSCLVSSTLFPRASLAAVARSPIPTLLSFAMPMEAISWRLTRLTERLGTFVALLLGLSWGTLEALETLVDGVPCQAN